MAKKRKHASVRRKDMRQDVRRAVDRRINLMENRNADYRMPYEEDEMYVTAGRRGHTIGEHKGEEARFAHGRNMPGDFFSQDHPAEGPRGFRPADRYGSSFEERMDLNQRMRIMHTNNGDMGPIRENFNNPCGLPYGAIQRDLGNGDYYSMNGYRVGDLYEQVDKAMRQDAAALKSITKPTNW